MHARIIVTSLMLGVGVVTLFAKPARADLIAAYAQGHGGLGNNEGGSRASDGSSSGLAPALGFQLGARVLIFEGYYDRTSFGSGAAVSRGILGLRFGVGSGHLRLVLHGGGGVVTEQGGALTGLRLGMVERNGIVARAGVALEQRLAPLIWGGAAVDGEAFSLAAATSSSGPRASGQDLFFSLYLKFELGV
jgi:hypothetical protein